MNLKRLLPALALLFSAHQATAQDWQYFYNGTVSGTTGNTTAYVWIPPNADHVRAILWAWQIVAEEEFVLDPAIRRAAMLERLAIVYFKAQKFNFLVTASEATIFNATMTQLAAVTGYPELQYAPVIPFGHSAAGLVVRNQLLHMPERVAAAILFKSGNLRNMTNAWPTGAVENYADVPLLAINGEFEEEGPTNLPKYPDGDPIQRLTVQADLHGLRAAGYKVSQVLDPGAGHYAWPNHRTFDDPLKSIPNYTALFLRKAMQRRVPAGQIATAGFLTLNTIPQSSSWLTDGNCTQVVNGAHAFADYPGSTSTAFCHVDEELARAWIRNNSGQFGKPRPYLNIPGLQKHSTDTTYDFSGGFGGNMSTGNRMDSTRNFFTLNGTVQVSSGNASATGQTVKFDRNAGSIGDPDPANGGRIKVLATRTDDSMYLVAFCEANADYHYRERTVRLKRAQLSNWTPTGSAQSIPPLLSNATAWIGTNTPFVFNATATSSALPIDYVVDYGPAVVKNGNQIHVAGIPIGSNLTSYKVRVGAGQRGSHPAWAGATQNSSIYTLNGTFPANAPIQPDPFALSISGNGTSAFDLTWPGMLGARYQLQQSTTLASGNWANSGAPIDGNGAPILLQKPIDEDAEFFRVTADGLPY